MRRPVRREGGNEFSRPEYQRFLDCFTAAANFFAFSAITTPPAQVTYAPYRLIRINSLYASSARSRIWTSS